MPTATRPTITYVRLPAYGSESRAASCHKLANTCPPNCRQHLDVERVYWQEAHLQSHKAELISWLPSGGSFRLAETHHQNLGHGTATNGDHHIEGHESHDREEKQRLMILS